MNMMILGAFIKKKRVQINFKSRIGMLMSTSLTLTDEIMKDIDSSKNGTGSLVLIRYCQYYCLKLPIEYIPISHLTLV